MLINGKYASQANLTCDGITVLGDFVLKTRNNEVLVCGYFDRAKAKVKSIACQFGRKTLRYGWNSLYTKESEYRTVYKPVQMGRDRFIYAMTFNKGIGERFILTTKESSNEDFFNFLMTTCKLPLLKEWTQYLFSKAESDRRLIDERLVAYSVYEERTIPIHGTQVNINHLKVLNVGFIDNDYVTNVVSEGLKKGEISICGKQMAPLKFESFDEYINNYGSSMVNNLEATIETLSPLNGKVDSVAFKNKRLYPQQAACINGIMALKKANSQYGLMVEGMGCGKTLQGAGVVDAYFNQEWLNKHPNKDLKDLYLLNEVRYRNIMMAPSHLVEKWKDEILNEIPGASVTIIDDFSKLVALRSNGKERKGREWYLISKDTCKLGSTYSPIPTNVGKRYPVLCTCKECEEAKGVRILKRGVGNGSRCPECGGREFKHTKTAQYGKLYGMICPSCGELLLKPSAKVGKDEVENPEELTLKPSDFSSRTTANSVCYNCGAQLWGVDVKPHDNGDSEWSSHVENHRPCWYKISHYKNFAKKSRKSAFVLRGHEGEYLTLNGLKKEDIEVSKREYGPRKYAPSLYIKKYLKGFFDFAVLDECHKYENGGTAQSNAAHALMHVSDFTLCLTGTISNGKADSFFYLLYMLDPRRMNAMGYKYTDVIEFTRKYGTIETVYEVTDGGNYNASSRGRQLQSPRVKPGISPLLFTDFLLDKSVFLDLSDLSKYIPTLHESVELVELPKEVKNDYDMVTDTLKEALHSKEGAGMLSNILQFGLSYPDKPYGRKDMVSPYVKDVVVAEVPNHEEYAALDNLLPKEEKLIEIVNQEISEGRNCFVYCCYTGDGETNVTQRLKSIIEEHCNLRDRVQILNATNPEPTKRERWIKQKASEGMKVFICNPKCVETGLDFCFWFGGKFYNFPTLVFYQMSYELAVIWQASRRHYRLNQTTACRTYYLAYEGTLQAAAVEIMAEKQVAASAIQGKFSAEGLTAMAQGIDPRLKLAEKLSKSDNSDRKTLENMFDALNQTNETEADSRYDGYDRALTYYEVMGETAVTNEVTEEFEFNFDENEDTSIEPIITEETSDYMSNEVDLFDSLFGFEDLTVGSSLSLTENLSSKPKKAAKKPGFKGQGSLFDFMAC